MFISADDGESIRDKEIKQSGPCDNGGMIKINEIKRYNPYDEGEFTISKEIKMTSPCADGGVSRASEINQSNQFDAEGAMDEINLAGLFDGAGMTIDN